MNLGAPRFEPHVQVQKNTEPALHTRFGFDSVATPHPEPRARFRFGAGLRVLSTRPQPV